MKNKLLSIDESNWFGNVLKLEKQDIMSLDEIKIPINSNNFKQLVDLSDSRGDLSHFKRQGNSKVSMLVQTMLH